MGHFCICRLSPAESLQSKIVSFDSDFICSYFKCRNREKALDPERNDSESVTQWLSEWGRWWPIEMVTHRQTTLQTHLASIKPPFRLRYEYLFIHKFSKAFSIPFIQVISFSLSVVHIYLYSYKKKDFYNIPIIFIDNSEQYLLI